LAIGVFPASKEVENEHDDEDDWRSTNTALSRYFNLVSTPGLQFGHSGRVFQAKMGTPFPRLLCGPKRLGNLAELQALVAEDTIDEGYGGQLRLLINIFPIS
jgi:hypothetical protein